MRPNSLPIGTINTNKSPTLKSEPQPYNPNFMSSIRTLENKTLSRDIEMTHELKSSTKSPYFNNKNSIFTNEN